MVRPLVVASHPHNNSLVVLVHGILSSRFRAWEPVIDMVQRMHYEGAGNAAFGSYDYYAFGYRSSLVQPPFETFFDGLRKLTSRERYDTVVLIGHSQGGVLAKLFLLDEFAQGRLDRCKVDLVITLDTPHRGPQPWIYPVVIIGGIWKRLPLLNKVPFWRQAADLGRWSANMRRLARDWNATNFPREPCAPGPRRRHLRSFTVSGTRLPLIRTKAVVSKKSADGFEVDVPLPGDRRTAFGLGHGVTAMRHFRLEIERLLSDHDAARTERHRDAIRGLDTAALSDVAGEACEQSALPCELETWKRRLANGFAARPLRGLPDALAAAHKFIRLRQRHP